MVHSIFKWGLERFLNFFLIKSLFFFRFSWCLLKDGRLSWHITVFFCCKQLLIVVAITNTVHSSFKGDLKDFKYKLKKKIFFRFQWFHLKIVGCVTT